MPPALRLCLAVGRPQILYLLGISGQVCQQGKLEVHLLCTDALSSDITRLLSSFNVPRASAKRLWGHNRSAAEGMELRRRDNLTATEAVMSASKISGDDRREWVNRLYAPDLAIYERFCKNH